METLHPPVFTLLMLLVVLSFGTMTKSREGDLPLEWMQRMGFSPSDLWFQKFEKIILSAFLTDSRRAHLQALVMIAVFVGGLEVFSQTWTTLAYFWGIHIFTLLFVSLCIIRPFKKARYAIGESLYLAKDVGPSAGYFGCMGVLIHVFPTVISWIVYVAILLGMLLYLKVPVQKNKKMMKLHADLAHLVAISAGFLVSF